MIERRKFQRWECSFPCECEFGDKTLVGRISDLSFNGARISARGLLPLVGTDLLVRIHAGNAEALIHGRVVHVEASDEENSTDGHFGVQFGGSREENLRAIMPLFQVCVEEDPRGVRF